jgi:cytochrome o ubiquinol oxidase subunit 1
MGFRLSEPLGRASFWCWLIGFYVAFMPLYVLGFMGMTRRLNHYPNPEWQPWLILAAFGVAIIAVGILCTILQIAYSVWKHEELRDTTGDPWDGRTLEWATSSPPPIYNFAETPRVTEIDAFANMKANGTGMFTRSTPYHDIHMPRNTPAGLMMGIFSIGLGFGLIWHIWWMVAVSAVAMLGALIYRLFDEDIAYIIPADEVKDMEMQRLGGVGQS